MPLRTLTIRGISDTTLKRLHERASLNRRSLNGELLAIFDAIPPVAPGASACASGVRESTTVLYAVGESASPPLIESVDPSALAEICRHHHIEWLAVFGSHARGDARPDSDIDVVVEFAPGKTPGFGLVRVAEALRPLFGGRRVDLLTRRGLSSRLRERILDSARTLHGSQ